MTSLETFYRGLKVLVTGHTGFKGGWLCFWLKEMGAEVTGLSDLLPPDNSFYWPCVAERIAERLVDVRNAERLTAVLAAVRPDLIFHLAARPLVSESFTDPVGVFSTNVTGTQNLLEALKTTGHHCPTIIVTSDKVYAPAALPCAEEHPLGGHDVYSMSKATVELLVNAYRKSFPALGPMATVRAGNVIGGGDYGQNRLVPDCVRAALTGGTICLRNPEHIRPWQYVLDCLHGYLLLGQRLSEAGQGSPFASAFNFGPPEASHVPVRQIVNTMAAEFSHPVQEVRADFAENPCLRLDSTKAHRLLGWRARYDLAQTLTATTGWYQARHFTFQNMAAFTRKQLQEYTQ